jgi:hypothetical protein
MLSALIGSIVTAFLAIHGSQTMQRFSLSQEDQTTVNRWWLAVLSVYSSIAVIIILLASSPVPQDSPTIQAQINPLAAQVVHLVQ